MDQLFLLTGKSVLLWGQVELLWYLIFTTLLASTPRATSDAIFFNLHSGAQQRDLILSVADTVHKPDANGRPNKFRKQLGKLQSKTNDLAGMRNAIAHAQLVVIYDQETGGMRPAVSPGSHPHKKNRLSSKDVILELRDLTLSLESLISDLERYLNSTQPEQTRYVPQDLLEALQKLGFQRPSWALPYPSHPIDN